MGCSMSSSMEPEDSAHLPHSHHKLVPPINSSPSNSSVEQGDVEADKGTKTNNNIYGGVELDKQNVYVSEILFLPGSPSFKDYCISHSRDASSETTDSAFSTKIINAGDDDSAKGDSNNKPGDNKGIKKKERIRGFKNAIMNKGMARRKRNFFNFGCYSSHASCDDIAMNKPPGKIA